jgi:HK97 family phage major capsid protein
MDQNIPFEQYAGAVSAFGSFGAPTLRRFRVSRRHVLLAIVVGLIAALYIGGALHGSAILLAAGPVAAAGPMTERERKLRERRLQAVTEARAVLDAGPADKALDAEPQARYDALMDEYDALGVTLGSIERSTKADEYLSASITEPTKPDPADAGDKRVSKRANATPAYKRNFQRYLLGGEMKGLIASDDVEARALQMDSDVVGGFVVAPQEFSDQIIKFVDNLVFIRGLATKYRVPNAQSLGVPQLTADPADADWTTELGTGSEDSSMAFGKREFRPHPLAKLLKISNKLIRAAGQLTQFAEDGETESPMSVDGLVMDRLGYKFGVAEEKAFLTGTGNLQPLGVFVASADGVPTSSDVTCASATAIAADDLINTKYSLKPQYLKSKGTAWLFHRDAIKAVRKLKDSNGQYLWAPGGIGQASLTVGSPDTILDLPFYQSEYAPNTFTTGLYVGMLADWRFYWIADALDMTVQRLVELYAATNQVGFIGRKETDGMPVLAEAFARVKLA